MSVNKGSYVLVWMLNKKFQYCLKSGWVKVKLLQKVHGQRKMFSMLWITKEDVDAMTLVKDDSILVILMT